MPKQNEYTHQPLSHPRSGVRLFKDDDEKMIALCRDIKDCDIDINILELIRLCVSKGLPLVEEKWGPFIASSKKIKERQNELTAADNAGKHE